MAIVLDYTNAIAASISDGYSSPVTVTRPSTTGSDRYWFVFITIDDSSSTPGTFPAGWTQIDTTYVSTGDGQALFGAYIDYALSSATEDFAINNPFWGGLSYSIIATGVAGVNVDSGGQQASSTDPIEMPAAGYTTTVANCLDVFIGSVDASGWAFGGFTPPTGYTSTYEKTTGKQRNLFIAEKQLTTAGAEGALTGFVDSGTTDRGMALRMALDPITSGTTHDATGALTGQGAVVVGSATNFTVHTSSGDLTGQGSVLSGSAARFRAFSSSGSLVGQGSVIAGSADRATPSSNHDASGSLLGQGSIVSGSSSRFREFSSSGALAGQGSEIAGTSARVSAAVTHDATGALVGQESIINGNAQNGSVIQSNIIGGGIDHQKKRRKATLSDKPNQHLDAIIAKSFKEVFNKLTDKKAPKEVQKKANKIVSDYSTEYRPTVNQVDWTEFNRDLEAVQRLFNLYNKEFAENQKVITEKLLFDLIENDNIEFLLMH